MHMQFCLLMLFSLFSYGIERLFLVSSTKKIANSAKFCLAGAAIYIIIFVG